MFAIDNNYETKLSCFSNNSNLNDVEIENESDEKEHNSNSENINEEGVNSPNQNKHRNDNIFNNTLGKKAAHGILFNLNLDKCENKNCNYVNGKKKVILNKKKIAKGKFLWLCISCTRCWNNGQYCYYCLSIYGNSNNCTDGKDWIQCDSCSSWVYFKNNIQHHIHCEEKRGHYSSLHKQLEDTNFKYFCPNCRQIEGKTSRSNNELLKKKRNAQRNNNINCKFFIIIQFIVSSMIINTLNQTE